MFEKMCTAQKRFLKGVKANSHKNADARYTVWFCSKISPNDSYFMDRKKVNSNVRVIL